MKIFSRRKVAESTQKDRAYKKNTEYLAMLDKSMAEAETGGFVNRKYDNFNEMYYDGDYVSEDERREIEAFVAKIGRRIERSQGKKKG